jgi:antibiotic biosynthesis monooxygenase (ABM) superfamily enzyme
MASPDAPAAPQSPATIVTQVRVAPRQAEVFRRWQARMDDTIAQQSGYLAARVLPPNPPDQPDWIVVQRFATAGAARAWLESAARERLLAEIRPALSGPDDVHLVLEQGNGPAPEPVSAVISTRVRPGYEAAFRTWQRKIAACQAAFAGYRGYKLQPPIPGVQDDWLTILRFDSQAHLQAWLDSAARKQLVAEAEQFTTEMHTNPVHYGFEHWFTFGSERAAPIPPAWKMNMIVLLVLYPVVFLFGTLVQTPLLLHRGVPPWLAVFVGNVFSSVVLGYWGVPRASRLLRWWLRPGPTAPSHVDALGAATVVACYVVALAVFSRFP